MKIALIAAVAQNGVIGRDNALPWHLPEDLKHFRAMTIGKPVIMGRKTWESLGRPLPGRTNIVITRQARFAATGAVVVRSLDEALAIAERTLLESGASEGGIDECVVIGGAELYAQALPRCDLIYFTEVHASVSGDTFFPPFERTHWSELRRERHAAQGNNPFDYSFVLYERKTGE